MSSSEPNDFLSAFYDGETAAGESAVAREFVQRSPEAAREVKEYERLGSLLRGLPRVAVPPEFAASVMQQAERESLIPLEPVLQNSAAQNPAPGQAVPQPTGNSRRRWILVSAISGAIAATLMISVGLLNRPKPRGSEEVVIRENATPDSMRAPGRATSPAPAVPALAKAESKVAASELDRRGLRSKSDENLLAPALKSPAASPSPAAEDKDAAPLSFAPKTAQSPVNEPVSTAQQSPVPQEEVGLVLPANLKTAQVGEVVEALQQDGKQVVVVRLTVVNQVEALDGVQSLLVRNTSQVLQNVDEIKRMRQRFAGGKAADVPKEALSGAPGNMICVYAEGSRAEMVRVLKGLQSERHIQEAELTSTIPLEVLEEFANSGVPPNQQIGGLISAQKQDTKQSAVTRKSAAGSQLAVSLPAATVDKIMSRGQQSASARNRRKGGPSQVQLGPQLDARSHSGSPQRDDLQVSKDKTSDSKGDREQRVASRRSSQSRSQKSAKSEQRGEPRDVDEVAAAQSFQVFFVITDQSQQQMPMQPQTPIQPLMPRQSKVGAGVQSAPQSGAAPRADQPASQVPDAAKQAAPNKSP
jgi:hypothetical protein